MPVAWRCWGLILRGLYNMKDILTVSQLNRYIKSLLDGDSHLQGLFLEGEISNFNAHYASGHFYFTLKDEKASVKAVMFSSYASRVRFTPKNGMRVLVRGAVSVYEIGGQYQLYVQDMQPAGAGVMALQFAQLKEKLQQQGLFDLEHKKPLPAYPNRIGVITSPTGAAVHDIVSILQRRYPVATVVLAPVTVQGESAPQEIAHAIDRFNALQAADVLIVGRGGGSAEDLWAFNSEEVAYAVYRSTIPVVSAVGHESDFTICDFVADLRAPTPSAAAELTVPDKLDLLVSLQAKQARLKHLFSQLLEQKGMQLDYILKSGVLQGPGAYIKRQKEMLSSLQHRLLQAMGVMVAKQQRRVELALSKLDSLSPLQVFSRGYAVVKRGEQTVKSVEHLSSGDSLQILFQDGECSCAVLETRKWEQ